MPYFSLKGVTNPFYGQRVEPKEKFKGLGNPFARKTNAPAVEFGGHFEVKIFVGVLSFAVALLSSITFVFIFLWQLENGFKSGVSLVIRSSLFVSLWINVLFIRFSLDFCFMLIRGFPVHDFIDTSVHSLWLLDGVYFCFNFLQLSWVLDHKKEGSMDSLLDDIVLYPVSAFMPWTRWMIVSLLLACDWYWNSRR